jgi:hypothetical protein
MKRHAPPLALMLALILSFAGGAHAQAKKMNVMDYYLALPDDCFYCEIMPPDLSDAFKRKLITRRTFPPAISRPARRIILCRWRCSRRRVLRSSP